MIQAIKNYLTTLQQTIIAQLSEMDGNANFKQDHWDRKAQGAGLTCVIQNGAVFEKGAVNFSHVHGKNLPPAALAKQPDLAGKPFEALGISLIMHPLNPFVPITHMNLRFFQAGEIWWFGGGYDLTPCYGFEADCQHWHETAQQACKPFGVTLYPKFKKWCDNYFFIKHRNEPRGIGGLFFDHYNDQNIEHCFAFVRAIGESFLPAYLPIVTRRKNMPFSEQQKWFQCYRRGRYVEFNLVYDRGTLFGLQNQGRVESILCSMPPEVKWVYDWTPQADTDEKELYDQFLVAKDWLSTR